MGFEWDESKRLKVIEQRGIDLLRMSRLFDGRPVLTFPSGRNDEQRWVTVGLIDGVAFAVAWTVRGENIRLITARRARHDESKRYCALHG